VARFDRQRQPDDVQPHQPGPQHRPVTTAVASGDLSKKITVDAKGEIAALADTINSMTDTWRRLPTRSPA